MVSPRVGGLLVAGALGASGMLGAGCGERGTITFNLEAPASPRLSPFSDPRRDAVALFDDLTGMPLGQSVRTDSPGGTALPIGDLLVGQYDVRITISGGAQLLGMGRTRGVALVAGQANAVTLQVRKPLAFFGSSSELGPGSKLPLPAPLMALDSTLPVAAVLDPVALPQQGVASISTGDGRWLVVGTRDRAPGGAGRVAVLDTLDLDPRGARIASLDPARGAAGPPHVRQLAISGDDATVAVVSDQGISLFALATLADGQTIPTVKLDDARAAAFQPDGSLLHVLTGPSWETLDCTARKPAQTFIVPLADPPAVQGPVAGPAAAAGATDIAVDGAGGLLFAAPCGDGVVDATGTIVLPGKQIFDLVAIGDRLVAIPGTLKHITVGNNPEDASVTQAAVVAGSRGKPPTSTPFVIPAEEITFQQASDGSPVQIRLQPSSMVAYQAAASPDGAHLLVADRVRYQADRLRFFELYNGLGNLVFYCELDVVRDVYRLSEIDVSSGGVGYQSVKGINDTRSCSFQCSNCDVFGSNCDPNPADSCAIADGFVPAGVSLLMGYR